MQLVHSCRIDGEQTVMCKDWLTNQMARSKGAKQKSLKKQSGSYSEALKQNHVRQTLQVVAWNPL